MIDVDVVVDVCDLRDVDYPRVADVHVLHVRWAAAIAGDPHITRAEGKPCYACASADYERDAKTASADEAYKGGRVYRAQDRSADDNYGDGSRNPSPRTTDD